MNGSVNVPGVSYPEFKNHKHNYETFEGPLVIPPESVGTVDPNTAGISGVEGQIYLVIIE